MGPTPSMRSSGRQDKNYKKLKSHKKNILNSTKPSSNLSKTQYTLMRMMTNHPDVIIINTDKNLAPFII